MYARLLAAQLPTKSHSNVTRARVKLEIHLARSDQTHTRQERISDRAFEIIAQCKHNVSFLNVVSLKQ